MKFKKLQASIISSLLFMFVNTAYAKESAGHSLFPTPEGFEVKKLIKASEYGVFDNNGSAYYCNKQLCTKKNDIAFDESGRINANGTVTQIEYKSLNGKKISSLQITRSYENTIKQLGGSRITDDREGVANLFVIKKNNAKIFVDVYPANNDGYYLTIIEDGGFVQIVTAGQLSDQINKQGFANLNVNFDTNKSVIKDGDKAAINEVVSLLKNDTKLKLSVEGHTDNVGAAAANKSLSQARSDSLVAYMVAAGIPAGRLVAKGFGSEVPVADNRTEEGKAKNRRVELVKIK